MLIQQLEKELAQIHEDMRTITEDQEAVNEELQSDKYETEQIFVLGMTNGVTSKELERRYIFQELRFVVQFPL